MSRLHSHYGSMAPADPLPKRAGLAVMRAERAARLDREAAARYADLAQRRGEDGPRYAQMAVDALASAQQWDAEASS